MNRTGVDPPSVERLDPRTEGDKLVSAEHLARYWWASMLVEGREVLDAACGTGYGTRMLAAAGAASCVGVDIAPEAVAAARDGDSSGRFVEGDLRELPFPDDSFDVAVSFETLEHMDGAPRAIDELRRVVRPGGLVVVSSPNRGVYPPGNPFHVHELTAAELADELQARFAHVQLFRQHPFLASAILDDEAAASDGDAPRPDMRLYKLAPLPPGGETYTLAVASGAPFEPPGSVVALADAFEVGWWHGQLAEAREATERERRERERERHEHERESARAADARARLEEQLSASGRRLLELERDVAILQERSRISAEDAERGWDAARKSWRHYEELEARLHALERSPSWRLTRPLRTAKHAVKRRLLRR